MSGKPSTVYINNLPIGTSEVQIRDKFCVYGAITAIRMPTLTKRGFAFVDFATEEESQRAIDALNGTEFLGNIIKVEKTRHKYGDNPHLKRQAQQQGQQQGHGKGSSGRYDMGGSNSGTMGQRYQRHHEQPYGFRGRDDAQQMNTPYHQFGNGMENMNHVNYYMNDYFPQFQRFGSFTSEYMMNQNENMYNQREMMPMKRFRDDD